MKILLLMPAMLMATALVAPAQTWTKTGAPSNSWTCIASSANGSKLAAGQWPGAIYVSTNSGTTWTPTSATNQYWNSVASSADGSRLVALADNFSGPGGVFTSTNSGATWVTNNLPSMYWSSVASSADGNIIVAAALGLGAPGAVFSSTNGGMNWISNGLNNVTGVAASADGRKMFASGGEQLFRSTNSGIVWASDPSAPPLYTIVSPSQYIACSADGNKVVLAVTESSFGTPPYIDVSTNGGDTWNLSLTLSNEWGYVASSANGNILVGVPMGPGPLFISTNSGASWSTNNSPANQVWGAAAASADGGKLIAAAGSTAYPQEPGPIYFSQTVQSPVADIIGTNSNVLVSWFVPSTNFVLFQSPDLLSWTNITNTPAFNTNCLQDYVALVATNKARFYRLRLQ